MQSAWQSIVAMHSLWRDAILLIALAPLAYYIFAIIAALRFLRRESKSPSGTNSPKNFTPPVSLLKPVHGVDFGSVENFESFCRQNYPDYEILFAVNDDSGDHMRAAQDVPTNRHQQKSKQSHRARSRRAP